MAEKKRKPSYLEEPLQKAAYKLGLVDNPSASAVRKDAYAGYTPKKKAAPKTPSAPAKGGVRITHGENSNASAMDRASADAARSRLPKSKIGVSGKVSGKAGVGLSTSVKTSVGPATRKSPQPPSAGNSNPMATTLAGKPKKAAVAPSKASVEAPKSKAKPSFSKSSSSPPAYTPPKAEKRVGGNVTSGFSGNWTGAAATDMQKRGGAKKNYGGGILGKLRNK